MTYDVAFGSSNTPPVVATAQSANSYGPSGLANNTTYYWKITAKDPSGAATSSAVFNFTTEVPTNNPPDVPENNTAAGSPADHAAGVSMSPTLHWTCTDPDGDQLTYDVHFGTSDPPPVLSTGLSAKSVGPVTTAYSTEYFWYVVAEDPSGATTQSAIFSFTTEDPPAETISTPDAPSSASGVDSTEAGGVLAYNISGSVSSLGHIVEYYADWGDGYYTFWTISTYLVHTYETAGTYDLRIQARCKNHHLVISDWSPVVTVTVTEATAESVTAPGTPTGAGTGEENESINYACDASTSNKGHGLEYRWDFGDGTITTWNNLRTRSHAWTTAGTYEVKAQARCADHASVESAWSDAKSVTITVPAAETVSTPNVPSGSSTGVTGENIHFSTGGAVSSLDHAVAYRYDWGDGTMSNWQSLATNYHTWSTAGTYEVKTQAQCINHPSILSEWSAALTVTITEPTEIILSPPGAINGITDGAIDESYDYTAYHSSQTNLGDAVEGRFDWGDGTTSAWIQSAPYTASHAWTTEGTYTVKYTARCATHTDVTAESDSLLVTISTTASETINKPGYINWQTTQRYPVVNTPTNYYVYGSASSLGHDVEVMYDWGDGTQTDWLIPGSYTSKTWTTAGTYPFTRQVRCIAHPEIVSEWSDPINMYPRDPETISTPPAPTGSNVGNKYQTLYFTATGATSSWHGDTWMEYRFDFGDGSALTDWSQTDTVKTHYFTNLGSYEVKVQARDAFTAHGLIESAWSDPLVVNIVEKVTIYQYGPKGQRYGATNVEYTWEIYQSASSDVGHAAFEYQFDFGDGTISPWSSTTTASHTYTSAGTYNVYYQARCAVDTLAESGWSQQSTSIEITDGPELVTTPDVPSYNSYDPPSVGDSVQLSTSHSYCNYGHEVEFQFDFGDGSVSPWIPGTPWSSFYQITVKHPFTSSGTFDVTCKARCAVNTSVESATTAARSVTVFEAIEKPDTPAGPTSGSVGGTLTYSTNAVTSSDGHTVEYQFQFYNYSSKIHDSPWSSSLSYDYAFTSTGSAYRVRVAARCNTHTNVIVYSDFTGYITIN
ncbi:MAG: PKD domain-containing protein [Candidatus Zixiibacteriota bacterium]|nr:MAG: PKD domain-containing protein [candidate division Zixibacteria bacterium]